MNGWLRLKARGNVDYVNDKVRQKFYASTAPALAGANGRYIESSYSETLFNGEVLAMFDKRLSPDWEFSATAGAGLNDRTVNSPRRRSSMPEASISKSRDATTGHRRSPTPRTKAAGSSIIRLAHRG